MNNNKIIVYILQLSCQVSRISVLPDITIRMEYRVLENRLHYKIFRSLISEKIPCVIGQENINWYVMLDVQQHRFPLTAAFFDVLNHRKSLQVFYKQFERIYEITKLTKR